MCAVAEAAGRRREGEEEDLCGEGEGRSEEGDKGWETRTGGRGHKYESDVGTRIMRQEWTSRTD